MDAAGVVQEIQRMGGEAAAYSARISSTATPVSVLLP